jgi:hypothetical protein
VSRSRLCAVALVCLRYSLTYGRSFWTGENGSRTKMKFLTK